MKKLSIVIIVVVFASINAFLGISYSQGKIDLKFLGMNAMADVEAPYCTGYPSDPFDNQHYTFTWATGHQILNWEIWYEYSYGFFNDHIIWAKNEQEARELIGYSASVYSTGNSMKVERTTCDSQNSNCCAVIAPIPLTFPWVGGY